MISSIIAAIIIAIIVIAMIIGAFVVIAALSLDVFINIFDIRTRRRNNE